MEDNFTIIPAILESSLESIKEKLTIASDFATKVQIDVADGKYVDNRTITEFDWLNDFETNLEIELHLMVADPEKYIENLPDKVRSVSAHIESVADPVIFAELVRSKNKIVGFASHPDTPVAEIEKYIETGDFFQFLTVVPGFQGSDFRKDILATITVMHDKHPNVVLQADGGVNPETAPLLVEAGITNLVSGSFIFRHNEPSDIKKAYQELRESVL